jgi:hypothetical protein
MDVELLQKFPSNLLVWPATKQHPLRYDDAGSATLGQVGHDVLYEETLGRTTADTEISLQLLGHFPAVGRVREDDLIFAVLADVLAVHLKRVAEL